MDNSKRKFLKRAGQSSAMLILFAYGGGKLLAANNTSTLKTKWNGLLLKDPKAYYCLYHKQLMVLNFYLYFLFRDLQPEPQNHRLI